MTRTTRHITLALVGSALLATCCIGSGFFDDEDPQGQKSGTTSSHRGYRRSRFWPGPFWWSRPSYSHSPPVVGRSSGAPSGGSRSSGGATSRGGFGGSGHASGG
jgi:hypothetical protein